MRALLIGWVLLAGCATDSPPTEPFCLDLGCPNPTCSAPDRCTCIGEACSADTPPTREFRCLTRRTCTGLQDQGQSVSMWGTDRRSIEDTLKNDCSATACDGTLTCEAICCQVDLDC